MFAPIQSAFKVISLALILYFGLSLVYKETLSPIRPCYCRKGFPTSLKINKGELSGVAAIVKKVQIDIRMRYESISKYNAATAKFLTAHQRWYLVNESQRDSGNLVSTVPVI